MNIESFAIENWGCIQRVAVEQLPPSGVVILHGPNRTGKSSIVHALRACLMDYPSNSRAQDILRWLPKGQTGDLRPKVTVVFRAQGQSYRITKTFCGGPSEFAVKTAAGGWRTETTSSSDAHECVRNLCGGKDSDRGLHQLLWLAQGEFELPQAKDFDPDVQQALRTILGDLQTPLDARFWHRLEERWNIWYTDPRKGTKATTKEKDNSPLANHRNELAKAQDELQTVEREFQDIERLINQVRDLGIQKQDCERQRSEQLRQIQQLNEEWKLTELRIRERQAAELELKQAKTELDDASRERVQFIQAQQKSAFDDQAVHSARTAAEAAKRQHAQAEQRVNIIHRQVAELQAQRAKWQEQDRHLAQVLRLLDDIEELRRTQSMLAQAEQIAQQIDRLESLQRHEPTLSPHELEAVKQRHERLVTLRAELAAASLKMTLSPEPGNAADVSVDGVDPQSIHGDGKPAELSFRRTAQVTISGWGRIQVQRGILADPVDELEAKLKQEEQVWADAIAPLGINPLSPDALPHVLRRDAESQLRRKELQTCKDELKKLAPDGLDTLQRRVNELQSRVSAFGSHSLTATREELHAQKSSAEKELVALEQALADLESESNTADHELSQAIQAVSAASVQLAAAEATAHASRLALERLPAEEAIAERLQNAEEAVRRTEQRVKAAAVTAEEATVEARRKAAYDAVDALDVQLREVEAQYHRNRGRIEQTEGLHARRTQLAARVRALEQKVAAETLERDAIDLLYRLFQECKEQRQNQLLGSIRDCMLGWMRLLDIGGYGDLRFNEAYLPESLHSSDGTYEMNLDNESIGAREQIAMLVRLAIGAALSRANDPAVAVLDDPLTHADVRRLTNMRAILRSVAQGDPTLQPPAGPLQILIFTCHPEWFRDSTARVIDLEDSNIMQRLPV